MPLTRRRAARDDADDARHTHTRARSVYDAMKRRYVDAHDASDHDAAPCDALQKDILALRDGTARYAEATSDERYYGAFTRDVTPRLIIAADALARYV